MPDFLRYQPPGVYIDPEEEGPLVPVVGLGPTVVALVGPSVGYRIFTEVVELTGTTGVQLSKLGINTASVVVTSSDGVTYTLTTDYTVTAGGGEDGQIGTTQDNTTEIARAGAGAIPSGGQVYVTYRYTDEDYNEPLRVRDYDDVVAAYGLPLDPLTSAIVSPISLAAKLALENGAPELVLVATTGVATATTRDELSAGYAKLAGVLDVGIVVPLPVGITGTVAAPGDTTNIGTDLKTHVTTLSDEDKLFRVGVIGYERTVTVDPLDLASGITAKRVMAAWPNRLNYFDGNTNTLFEVSGYYLAAAYAGRLAAQDVQMPLTKKQVVGFSGLPPSLIATMSESTKNDWSDGGLAVTEQLGDGRLLVRHGVTTDPATVYTREMSLVRAKDALVTLLQRTVEDANLIGTYIDEDTAVQVQGVVQGVLEQAADMDVIIAWADLSARQLSVDPSIIEVKFAYMPAYPLNYIVISFRVDTSTGETNVLELAA